MKSIIKTKKQRVHISVSRFNFLFFIIFLLFGAIIFRLAYIQLIEGEKYKDLAEINRTKSIPISAPRGLIKDSNNEILVSNKTVWTITFEINEEIDQDFDNIAMVLADLLTDSDAKKEEKKNSILESMDIGPFYKASKYIPRIIEVDVDDNIRAYIEEHKLDIPGVEVISDQMRNYIYGDFMAQVIGYTRSIPTSETEYYQALGYKLTDHVGIYGLEKQYENILYGQDGQNVFEVSSDYSKVEQKTSTGPIPGNNIILTIDRRFEEAVEKSLEDTVLKAKEKTDDVELATAVVLDVNTGAVLAMANYPRFDPNWYNGPISQELYQNYIMPYEANTAIRARYPIGSSAKPLTVLVGLEKEVIGINTVIYDGGRIAYDRNAIGQTLYMNNYNGKAFGSITLKGALKYSSNVFMTEIALRLKNKYGIAETLDIMRYYNNMFGLGVKTGIDLPEELPGYLSTTKNYVQQSIGQNDTYTVLQLAQYTSTIANGGYKLEPYLVEAIEEGGTSGATQNIIYKHEPKVLNKIDVSPENLKAVQEGMYQVTQPGGTAYYSFIGLPIKVAAKTGTAQASDKSKEDHTIIMGYAPYDNPQIAFAVIVPHGSVSGISAGLIARDIIEAYLEFYQ
ncbi:MAG: peptidoglycan D,D-transpeptidase FtsI family protein [Vulcanibacillus sp.]